ncbi:hypothetical protein [Oceanospirillum sediminis]|uniref:Uncharacterized protein n=1 Tax=Oceanospirillum sediminis TaxID=2760088 RepID=A0A839IXA5_9GAMM|nr:hypothetical protein [Oceanospirillum sediminis]MBB1489601.1 hypothetical protein [Oceanospirillum sediminis]
MKIIARFLIKTLAFLLLYLFFSELFKPLFAQTPADEPPTESFWQIAPIFSGQAEPPPEIRTYQLPRFDNHAQGNHHSAVPPLKLAPAIDYDALYQAALNCYPEKSKFGLEVELEGAFKNRKTYDYTGSEIGQHYIGLVARMPLYSASELNREREREYKRRTETASTIGAFLQALAKRNHSIRQLGLYQSLEARSQIRVQQGVATTAEQVQFLEKVALAQESLITAETALAEHRLGLIAACSDDKAPLLNDYLKRISVKNLQPPEAGQSSGQNAS